MRVQRSCRFIILLSLLPAREKENTKNESDDVIFTGARWPSEKKQKMPTCFWPPVKLTNTKLLVDIDIIS